MRSLITRTAPAAFVSVLLLTLALGAPVINAASGAPRSVFLHLREDAPVPELSLRAEQLPSGRWRLYLDATAFRFTDICVTDADAIPVGHAHIIVAGQKIASAFQPVIDLPDLPPGAHVVTAILRGQDHRAFLGPDGLLKAEIVVRIESGSQRSFINAKERDLS